MLNNVGDNFDRICETTSLLKNHPNIMIFLLVNYEDGPFYQEASTSTELELLIERWSTRFDPQRRMTPKMVVKKTDTKRLPSIDQLTGMVKSKKTLIFTKKLAGLCHSPELGLIAMPARGGLLPETNFTLLKLLDALNAERYGSEAARVALVCSDMHQITTNDYEWTYLTSRWLHVDLSLQLHMHKNSLLSKFHRLRDVILDNTEHYTSQ